MSLTDGQTDRRTDVPTDANRLPCIQCSTVKISSQFCGCMLLSINQNVL